MSREDLDWIEISPLISSSIKNWPGDMPFSIKKNLSFQSGDHLELSGIETSLHVGAHADSPLHYHPKGRSIDELPVTPYLGLCQVIQVSVDPGARIFQKDLSGRIRAPRVLFRTDSFKNPETEFHQDFNSLSPELISYLKDQGVVLVGIDTPSVDPFQDQELLSHQALYESGILNLEGLVLSHVNEGLYHLVALPLRIHGADASPVRAVLLKTSNGIPS